MFKVLYEDSANFNDSSVKKIDFTIDYILDVYGGCLWPKDLVNINYGSADKKTNIDELKDLIFDNLDLVRVYLKPQGRKADMEDPLVIKKGSTVIDACGKLHREFVKNFRHAKVWGTSVKFPGQKVGPDHVLDDEDVLRIILKK